MEVENVEIDDDHVKSIQAEQQEESTVFKQSSIKTTPTFNKTIKLPNFSK